MKKQPWMKTKFQDLLLQMESHVHFPFIVASGCCKSELENVMSSTYDWSRLGVQRQAEDPQDADLLIVAGWIDPSFAQDLREVYVKLIGRKSVIAVGACSISGGPYLTSGVKPVLAADILPVDVFVPGCPPRPEAIIEAVRLLKDKMRPKPSPTTVLYSALKDHSRHP